MATKEILAGGLLIAMATAQGPANPAQQEALKRVIPANGVVELPLPRRDDPPCPFSAPRLAAADPAEVAWAAHQLAASKDPALDLPAATELVIAALRTMRAGKDDVHREAELHLLHAALVHNLVLPAGELRAEPAAESTIPWLALQTRAATKDGREVFQRFQQLDPTTQGGWEVLGDALAARDHSAFALELRTQMTPRLRIFALRHPPKDDRADEDPPQPPPPPTAGLPSPPVYHWTRDRHGLLTAAPLHANQDYRAWRYQAGPMALDRARLRWLAELSGEPAPTAWAARFFVKWNRREMTGFEAFAQESEQRARAVLDAADAAFRQRFRVPAKLVFPALDVVWEDGRSDADRAAMPMPARKQ